MGPVVQKTFWKCRLGMLRGGVVEGEAVLDASIGYYFSLAVGINL